MKILTAKIKINPPFPIIPFGFIQQTKKLHNKHDDLHARIIGFNDNDELNFHISCDLIGLPISFQENLFKNIQNKFQNCKSCTISCTHTHYAPTPYNDDYLDYLHTKLLSSFDNLNEFESDDLSISVINLPFDKIGKSRISNHNASVMLHTFSIYQGNNLLACFIIHNCHPTILHSSTEYFTSEYPGYVLRKLEEVYPNTFFSFIQGAAGDISSRFIRASQGYEAVETLGDILFNQVHTILKTNTNKKSLNSVRYHQILFDLEHDTNPLELTLPDRLTNREIETIEYGKIMREKLLNNKDALLDNVLLSALSFNDYSIIFSPNELFSSYLEAIDLEKATIGCYSNGYGPYITGIDDDFITYERFTDTLTKDCKEDLFKTINRLSKK